MFEYAFDVDIARFAVIIGLFITLLFYDRLKIAPGGMVVPGYIVIFINHPMQILYTFLVAFAVYLVVGRILMNHMILFGRRRFTVTVLTGAVFAVITESLIGSYASFEPFIGYKLIGIIIPGLIAHELIREHKPVFILMSIGFVTILTFGFVWIVAQIEWVLFSAPNIILLGLLTIDLILLIGFTVYLLFFFSWENYFGLGSRILEKIKSTFKKNVHRKGR